MNFGSRLKCARVAAGYTQTELGKLVGVAKSTLAGYEKGNREPDVLKIKKIAQSLGVSADYLIIGETRVDTQKDFHKAERLLELFNQLSDSKQDEAILRIEEMVAYTRYLEKRAEDVS